MALRFSFSHWKALANLSKHGVTGTGQLLVVAHAERGDEIRLISARVATPAEWSTYAQGS